MFKHSTKALYLVPAFSFAYWWVCSELEILKHICAPARKEQDRTCGLLFASRFLEHRWFRWRKSI